MINIDLGSIISSLYKSYNVFQFSQNYDDYGNLIETLSNNFDILASIQVGGGGIPKSSGGIPKSSGGRSLFESSGYRTNQLLEIDASRVSSSILIITKSNLDLSRKNYSATYITYNDENYKILSKKDWSQYGYYTYGAALLIGSDG